MRLLMHILLFLCTFDGISQGKFRETRISYPDTIFVPYENLYLKNNFVIYFDTAEYVGFYTKNVRQFNNLEYLRILEKSSDILVNVIQDSIKLKEIAYFENDIRHGKVSYYLYDSIEYMNGFYCYGKPCGLFTTFEIDFDNENIISNNLGALINYGHNNTKTGLNAIYGFPIITQYKTDSRPPKYEHYQIDAIYKTYTYKNGKRHGPSFEYEVGFNKKNEHGELVGYTLWKDDKVIDGKYLQKYDVYKYKNGELIKSWNYDEGGELGLYQRKDLGFMSYYFNFNKLIFPLNKILKGKMEYEDYINKKMR